MSRMLRIAILILLVGVVTGYTVAHAANKPATQPVIVELFTSEGCSSCPPAEDLLGELSRVDAVRGAEILPLEFHVDYFNDGGWADPFSSAGFTRRQEAYAKVLHSGRVYTPQMIVDGSDEFLGSDRPKAVAAIERAARARKGSVTLHALPISQDGKSIEFEIAIDSLPANTGARVLLAVTEADLASAVMRGENAGRRLSHVAVVRSLTDIATIKAGQALPVRNKTTVRISPDWQADHLRAVVFVQEEQSGRVIAAASEHMGGAGNGR